MAIRALYQNKVSGLTCVISGVSFAVASLVQLIEPRGVPRAVYIGLAIFGGYFVAFRLGRGGIAVLDEGVVVRNPLRTSEIIPTWEVSGCVLDTWHGLPDVAFLVLKNGKRIPVAMLEISPLSLIGKDDSVHRAIDDFNEWIRRVQSASIHEEATQDPHQSGQR